MAFLTENSNEIKLSSSFMNTLYILNESFTNGYRVGILDLISIVSIISGIFVIISKNPIVSILFLFILMLINVRISELLSNTSNSIPLAIIITIAFNYPVYQLLPYSMVAINGIFVHLNNKLSDNLYNSYGDTIYNSNFYSINNNDILFVTSKI